MCLGHSGDDIFLSRHMVLTEYVYTTFSTTPNLPAYCSATRTYTRCAMRGDYSPHLLLSLEVLLIESHNGLALDTRMARKEVGFSRSISSDAMCA